MGKVFTHMTMSLDGFIADPKDDPGELFDWYQAGEVDIENQNETVEMRVDDDSAEVLREWTSNTGALIAGRRLFDIADGWGDKHPVNAPVVVVTHQPPADAATKWPTTTFVDSVEAGVAKAQEIAGDRHISIASASIIQQALALGLVDEVYVSLVPVLFGEGISYFGKVDQGHLLLEDPEVVRGRRATHLRYKVSR
ncbi:dihydrofolate reductase family protein [Tenggerimyces flavus]|uniref:Dihydrofolate reductase family protein n=1 Tax=Tenggerimyces flavus TaxID=1708749 RepID=A0ABV7Y955_9ACTN|nr:dihydrofolate reductase family protein [Tenggerimyces flavus]